MLENIFFNDSLDVITNRVMANYFTKESVLKILCQYNDFKLANNVWDKLSRDNGRITPHLKSVDDEGNCTIEKLLTFFNSTISDVLDLEANEEKIITAIHSEYFSEIFSEEEQNTLLVMFAIFIDSYNYWEANISDWDKAFDVDFPPFDPLNLDGLSIRRFVLLAMADAQGVVDNKGTITEQALITAATAGLVGLAGGPQTALVSAGLWGAGTGIVLSGVYAGKASKNAYGNCSGLVVFPNH